MFDDWDTLKQVFDLPDEITLEHASRVEREMGRSAGREKLVAAHREETQKRLLAEQSTQFEDFRFAWKRLDANSRHTVLALYELSFDLEDGRALCSERLAQRWANLSSPAKWCFCWHPKLGLGVIEEDEEGVGVRGDVWLYATAERKAIRDLSKWRTVSGASAASVAELERLAYGTPLPDGGGRA